MQSKNSFADLINKKRSHNQNCNFYNYKPQLIIAALFVFRDQNLRFNKASPAVVVFSRIKPPV